MEAERKEEGIIYIKLHSAFCCSVAKATETKSF